MENLRSQLQEFCPKCILELTRLNLGMRKFPPLWIKASKLADAFSHFTPKSLLAF